MSVNHWEIVHGWFDFHNIYNEIADKATHGCVMVEIGTWMGKSTCYLAQKLKDLGKKVNFYACDKFKTPQQSPFKEICLREDFYDLFIYNLKLQGVENIVIPIVGDTLTVSTQFQDNTIDFIFIDDDHNPSFVEKELEAWYPKMKPNSMMYGHDYQYLTGILDQFAKKHHTTWKIDGNSWIMPTGAKND